MGQEVDFIKLQNNQILNQCSMPSEIERIRRGLSDLYGFQELMPPLEILGSPILRLWMDYQRITLSLIEKYYPILLSAIPQLLRRS